MDSLKDLLMVKDLEEPTEVTALRQYVQDLFKITPTIKISKNYVTVIVKNGKLATELRGRQMDIERRCQLTRKLFVKVQGSSR